MTEHSAVIFVFFFLAEYASIIIINIFSTILFFGGYLMDISLVTEILRYINIDSYYYIMITDIRDSWASLMYTVLGEGFINGIIIGIKSCILVFIFIWVRASFPRIRYDQLMSFCWTILLPQIVGFIILYPCIFSTFSIFSVIWL